jgi:hypothetical protein
MRGELLSILDLFHVITLIFLHATFSNFFQPLTKCRRLLLSSAACQALCLDNTNTLWLGKCNKEHSPYHIQLSVPPSSHASNRHQLKNDRGKKAKDAVSDSTAFRSPGSDAVAKFCPDKINTFLSHPWTATVGAWACSMGANLRGKEVEGASRSVIQSRQRPTPWTEPEDRHDWTRVW